MLQEFDVQSLTVCKKEVLKFKRVVIRKTIVVVNAYSQTHKKKRKTHKTW